jgi:hypothetical protein
MGELSMLKTSLGTICLLTSIQSFAATTPIVGKVTMLESSYMPDGVVFFMDTGTTTCPAGSVIRWVPQRATAALNNENNKVVYSTLMAALASGKKIRFYVNDNDPMCQGSFLHLLGD